MSRIRTNEDIKPVSEFRANTASVLQRVQETGGPVVLTQRGRTAAILLSAGAYDELLDELELLRDVRRAERELAEGLAIDHSDARHRAIEALNR